MTRRVMRWCRVLGVLVVLVVLGALGEACRAGVHFLVIGGGPNVYHNEVFFEKNVGFFREVMSGVGLGGVPEAVLFAGGGARGGAADVCYLDPASGAPEVNRVLSEVFEGKGDVNVRYRPHEVKGVVGGATRKDVIGWFSREGAKLGEGDVLFVYVTTHGGGSGRPNEAGKATIALWGDESIAVSEFAGLLDRLPAGVRVVTVMVQCYCGGFGDIVFTGGEYQAGRRSVAAQSRCGFFATLSWLTATGCTPDVREETYADYSTNFFAALGGRERGGKVIPKETVDLDGDGRVSLAEAHAYAMLAESVDIPTTTSEVYLRRVSKLTGTEALKGQTFEKVRAAAGMVRGKTMDVLGNRLNILGGSKDAVAVASEIVDAGAAEKRDAGRRRGRLWERYGRARGEVRRSLEGKWPELGVGWHPAIEGLLREHADEIVKFVEGQRAYGEMRRLGEEVDATDEIADRAEVRRVGAMRFLRTAATVCLEGRLSELKGEEREEYRRLIEAEGGTVEELGK